MTTQTPTPTTDPDAPRLAFDGEGDERRAIVTNAPEWSQEEQDSAILGTAMRLDALVHLLQERGIFTRAEYLAAIEESHRMRLGRVLHILASEEVETPPA